MKNLSWAGTAAVVLLAVASAAFGFGEGPASPRFKAVAFDYFVIFDPNSVIPAVERAYPGRGIEFARPGAPSSSSIASCGPSPIAMPISSRSLRTRGSTSPPR